MITIDQGDGTIADMPIENETEKDPRTDGDAEVETEIIETGETILMIGPEGAARTLLTHGPVVEEMIPVENLQAGQNLPNPLMCVDILPYRSTKSLIYLRRHQKHQDLQGRARPIRKPSDWQSWTHGKRKLPRIRSGKKKNLVQGAHESFWTT